MDPFELYPRAKLSSMVARINIRNRTTSGHVVRGSGTGTVIYNCSRTQTVLILTCGHIVLAPNDVAPYSEPTYSVCFPDDEGHCSDDVSYPATLLTDTNTHILQDIAVLKVKVSVSINKVAAHFRNVPVVEVMPVFTCSNMFPSKHFSHLTGRVNCRSSRTDLFGLDENLIPTCVEFTLDACGAGASGSGVFDMDGNILAILVSSSTLMCRPGIVKSRIGEDVLAGYTFEYKTHLRKGIPIAPVLEVLRGLIPAFNLQLVSTNTTYLADINPLPCLPSSSRCLDQHSTPNTPTLAPCHSRPFDPLEGFPWAVHCKKAVKIKACTHFYSGRTMISFKSGTIIGKSEGITIVLTCGGVVQNVFNYEVERVDFEVQFCDNTSNRMVEGVSCDSLVAHLITNENLMLGEHLALLYVEDPLGRGEVAQFRESDLVNGMQIIMCANNFEDRYSFVTGRVTSRNVQDHEFVFDAPILTYVEYAIASDHNAKGAGLFDLDGNLIAVHVGPCDRVCKISHPEGSRRDLLADHHIYHASPIVKGISIRWISRVLSTLCKRFELIIGEGQVSANSLLLNVINYLKNKTSSPLISKPKHENPPHTKHSTQITSLLPNDDPLRTFCWENLCRMTVRVTILRFHSDQVEGTLTGTIIFNHNDITLILTRGLDVWTYIDAPEPMFTFWIEFSREDGEELCPARCAASLLSNEEALKKGIAIFSVKDSGKRKVAHFRKNPPLDGMQLLKCAISEDTYTFCRTEGRVSSRHVPDCGFIEYPIVNRDSNSFGAGLFDIQGALAAVHIKEVRIACRVDPEISPTSNLGIYRFAIPGCFYRGIPISLVIVALEDLCRSLGLKIDMTEGTADTMLLGICEYARAMPTSGGNPSFARSQPSTEHTPSGKENLCLYGFPSEQWEVPPELPGPTLGINFARDGMQGKDWLALVVVHSDAWLLPVAFYFGARRRLFNMINDFPAIFEAVTGNAKKQVERSTVSNHSCAKSKSSTKSHPRMKVKHAKASQPKEGGGLEEEPSDTSCGAFGETYASGEFWICCDTCKTWFHGKCAKMKPARSSLGNQAVHALPCLHKQKIIPDFLDVSWTDFTSLFSC